MSIQLQKTREKVAELRAKIPEGKRTSQITEKLDLLERYPMSEEAVTAQLLMIELLLNPPKRV